MIHLIPKLAPSMTCQNVTSASPATIGCLIYIGGGTAREGRSCDGPKTDNHIYPVVTGARMNTLEGICSGGIQ